MSNEDSEVLWIDGMCAVLNKPKQTVRHMIARKQIPTRRLGRRVYALRSELEAYLHGLPVVTA